MGTSTETLRIEISLSSRVTLEMKEMNCNKKTVPSRRSSSAARADCVGVPLCPAFEAGRRLGRQSGATLACQLAQVVQSSDRLPQNTLEPARQLTCRD